MSTITREQLIERLQHRISVASGFQESEKAQMDLELARIALASLEAEAVYQVFSFKRWRDVSEEVFEAESKDGCQVRVLYTAPPAPVSVPDGYRLQPISEYDAMCAAMLQGADGNSPVIPDGWVLVPEEPTHEMLEAGDEQFGTYDVYRRMIAAAPQQEVKP